MRKILVYFNDLNVDKLLGYFYVDNVKGSEIYSFEYAKDALTNIIKDPEIKPILDRQFKEDSKDVYKFIQDCCPNRWGTKLIELNEIKKAKKEERTPRKLLKSDILLAIPDFYRMGALRFKLDGEEFTTNNNEIALTKNELKIIENAAYDYFNCKSDFDLLLKYGIALGGSRPKITFKDVDGDLYLAKFPSKTDEYDISGYEMVANELARKIGLNVPETKLIKLSNHGYTFIVKRFDRDKEKRLSYVSFMTLLNANDGENNEYSYLDIVNKIKEMSSRPKEDLLELFKRVALNIVIHNNDDHLRNHGMLYVDNEWILAPVFDINPTFDTTHLSLNIDLFNNVYSLKNLIDTSKFYLLDDDEAKEIVEEIINIVKDNFLDLARKYHLPNNINKLFLENFTLKII